MKLLQSYKHTLAASYIGYVTQSIINNFCPLLLVLFNQSLGLSMAELTWLVTANFIIQLVMDLISSKLPDWIGYRACAVGAHAFCVIGLTLFGLLPTFIMPNEKFLGLMIGMFFYSLGGGLIEVLISPITEACPTKNKAAIMCLLHSFFSWGTMTVVIVTTLFLHLNNEALSSYWWALSLGWALIPLLNGIYFLFVPLYPLTSENKSMPTLKLFKLPIFWAIALLIFSAGAAELAISQWASTFVKLESSTIPKIYGDILGPCLFAFFSGFAKVIYFLFSKHLKVKVCITLSGFLTIGAYLITALSTNQWVSAFGIGLSGLGIGILWPSAFSIASHKIPEGGTSLFAYLALTGDLGCYAGPTVVGWVNNATNNLKFSILVAIVFPILVIISSLFLYHKKSPKKEPLSTLKADK